MICKRIYSIHATHKYHYNGSIELDNGIILDFDENGVPVALEILNASHIFQIPKYGLKNNIQGKAEINITHESISLELTLNIEIHNKKVERPLNLGTINDTNISPLKTSLQIA